LRPLALGLVCVGSAVSAEPVQHNYTVTVDYLMSRLWVEARFAQPVKGVIARSRDAGRYLLDVRSCRDDQQIRMRNQRMMLPEHGISCMNYTVDLARAANAHRFSKTMSPENIIVSPAYWMWRPELRGATSIRVSFRLPESVQIAVPWQRLSEDSHVYVLAESPESAYAPVIFGKFDYREIEVPGATLRVSLLAGVEPMDNEAIARWIRATATDVSLAYGRFPSPSPQVVVIPVGGSRGNNWSAVPFGRVIRDGGETIELQVDQSQPLEVLLEDWTATHEFSHLMLPYVERKHRWISEGFAQYYQNVLLSRSGAYDDLQAWQEIHDGYERGRLSRPELSPNEASSGSVRASLMKVYWSGAALALMADVQLRERSNGTESLDDVLDRFQACCLPSHRVWSGPELFAYFDELASAPIFMPLYKRFADTAGFPDTSEIFQQLGLTVSDGKVHYSRGAESHALRDAILETDDAAADWRAQLTVD
jgi:predicted metalloprotease with PDZ domain